MQDPTFDFIVVGAGMAGVSIAAELSREARVALVERESQPGYHATGRSAALFSELYGNATIRGLTRASACTTGAILIASGRVPNTHNTVRSIPSPSSDVRVPPHP